MRTVLVTGTDGGAAQSIVKCLRMAGGYRIITTGIDPMCIGLHTGDVGYIVPKLWDEYKEKLKEICDKEGVELIIPGSDIELSHFASEIGYYNANCPPILIDVKNVVLARDKYLLQKKLEELGFPCIKTWKYEEFEQIDKCPLVLKPRHGYGSNMLFKEVTRSQVEVLAQYMLNQGWEPIAQEQLYGDEYSCMTLRAKDGELLTYTIALSVKKFGQSFKTVMLTEHQQIEELIIKFSEKINSIGPLSIQLIEDENKELKIFEINARFTGAQIVRAYGGVNMVDLAVRNWLDGVKEYPRIKEPFVAYWYHDFAYSSLDYFLETLKNKRTEGRKLVCPKYL